MSETSSIAQRLGISPGSTMAYSYSGGRVALADADTRWTWSVLHPWAKMANLHAFFSHSRTTQSGVDPQGLPILHTPMGVGSAGRQGGPEAWANFWSRHSRTYLPGRPSRLIVDEYGQTVTAWLKLGMAPIAAPGTSVHEDDTYQNRALALDAIGWEDGEWVTRLTDPAKLLTFFDTGNEPWHSQPKGYRKSKSQLQEDLRLRPLPTYPTLPPVRPLPRGEEMFYPIKPVRNSDTRLFGGPVDAGKVVTFGLAEDIFPPETSAISLNLTVLGDGSAGYVTVWPDGDTPPKTSMLNLAPGQTSPAIGSINVGVVNRTFRLRSTVRAHLIADISGYWT